MEKVTSIYWSKEPYIDGEGKQQYATVKLEIDYRTKHYNVTPYCGTINEGFKFEKTSHKWKMWKALLVAIDKAIDFANTELGLG